MPNCYIFAGPNGVGKTTFAKEFLPEEEVIQFVNADLIAAGISPFAPDTADFAAGRIMLRRLDDLVSQNSDFAMETTLSGSWLAERIVRWRDVGYYVRLYFVCLESPDASILRIRQRVLEGGHYVPDATVRRRYQRSLNLFETKYKHLVDHWMVYDNSGDIPILVDEKP